MSIKALACAVLLLLASILPATAAEPIRIGFSCEETGGSAASGRQFLLTAQIWADRINKQGGLLGRPVELIHYDDQSNPALVPGIYAKLLDVDKVDLVVSPFATNQIAPAMPIVSEHRMVFMALFGTGVNDEFRYDRYFQILPNGPEGNRSLSTGFFQVAVTMTPAPRTVAIVAEGTEYGQTAAEGARANVAGTGLKIVYDRNY